MQTAVYVGVVVLIVMAKRLEHSRGFLRGCSVVEVNQRLSVRLLAKYRKVFANGLPIDVCGSNLVHGLICSVCDRVPIYSGTARKRLSSFLDGAVEDAAGSPRLTTPAPMAELAE